MRRDGRRSCSMPRGTASSCRQCSMKVEPAAAVRGAVADGTSRIHGFGRAEDTESAIAVVRALGVEVEEDGDDITVRGVGLRGLRSPAAPIDCGNAGTVLRLVTGLLAGQRGTFELVGDTSLSARP